MNYRFPRTFFLTSSVAPSIFVCGFPRNRIKRFYFHTTPLDVGWKRRHIRELCLTQRRLILYTLPVCLPPILSRRNERDRSIHTAYSLGTALVISFIAVWPARDRRIILYLPSQSNRRENWRATAYRSIEFWEFFSSQFFYPLVWRVEYAFFSIFTNMMPPWSLKTCVSDFRYFRYYQIWYNKLKNKYMHMKFQPQKLCDSFDSFFFINYFYRYKTKCVPYIWNFWHFLKTLTIPYHIYIYIYEYVICIQCVYHTIYC